MRPQSNNDLLVLSKSEVIAAIHNATLKRARISSKPTPSTPRPLRGGLPDGIPVSGNQLCGGETARACADEWTARTPEKPRYVAVFSARPTARRLFLRTSTIRHS